MLSQTLLLSGCGVARTQIINDSRVEKVKIPPALFEVRELKKPTIKNENDFLEAYIDLYSGYRECLINLKQIKKINDDF